MSVKSNISLLDLSRQLPFNIDENLKKQLCFGQALLISCGHYEGDIEVDGEESQSESDWESTVVEEEKSTEEKDSKSVALNDQKEEDKVEKEQEKEKEDDDFYFYFFPDCSKPEPELDPKGSLVMENGFPKLNPPLAKKESLCTCPRGQDGICKCFVRYPCVCGKKKKEDCTCENLKKICICEDPNKPAVKCECKHAEICTCIPTEMFPQTTCTCDKLEKVCICSVNEGQFASPVCVCEQKRIQEKHRIEDGRGIMDEDAGEEENVNPESTVTNVSISNKGEEIVEKMFPKIPCDCTSPDIKPLCRCILSESNKCTCGENECTCEIQRLCVCEPEPNTQFPPCKSDNKIEICECPRPEPDCKCETCECANIPEKPFCTCENSDNCKCFKDCACVKPCLCDTVAPKEASCICIKDNMKAKECTCGRKVGPQKLKRVKVGKEGYRWCKDVDPRHTYFDYAYDRHDKIDPKHQEREMFKVLGLHDEKIIEEECPVHGIKAPEYKKKVKKPSLDCCSTVGGISINVETLGEREDKFLVQVVSNALKEGAKTGTKLISIVDCNLHTLEENRIEHITKGSVTKERRSYLAISDSGYYNKVTRTIGEKSVIKRFNHSFEDAHDFLLEGANVVFLRYIGLARFRGNVKTDTILMNGIICQSIYVSHGVTQSVVNNTPLFVVKVERHIIEPSGRIHQTLSVVTLRGYLVSHEWADNNYVMHINPLLKIDYVKDMIEEHAPLRERWREDLQLFSDYLDFKSKRTAEGARYMHESGELTSFVKDYLQAILLLKPQNVLPFTKHYFAAALSSIDLPHDEHFEPHCKHVRYYYLED